MNFVKILRAQVLRGACARRVLIRAFLVMFALAIFPSLQVVRDVEPGRLFAVNSHGCIALDEIDSGMLSLPGRFLKPMVFYAFPTPGIPCREMANISKDMFGRLIAERLLKSGAKSLCVGEGTAAAVTALQELGFSNTFGLNRHPFFSLMKKRYIYELEFNDDSFDFVFSSDIRRVSVPALLVLEIERVLKPGGIGAILIDAPVGSSASWIKSATPISLFLKSSEVLRVRSVNQSFTLVLFRKNSNLVNPFEHYQLPSECPSVEKNQPFIEQLEPLLEGKEVVFDVGFSYLSQLTDISSRKRFIYIDIGAGQYMKPNTTNWFLSMYPLPSRAVDVYVVDHNTTVLSSYVNKPGITFVYHPGLAGNTAAKDVNQPQNSEGFDFLVWFREIVSPEDFVILKMNAVGVELQLLHELFESGGICLVDELFLRCPGSVDGGEDGLSTDCMHLFKGLRKRGVFVHQWLQD